MVGCHVAFILAVFGIDEEVKPAIGVLHLCQEVGFPFGFLHDVADAVAAFRNAEVIERGDAGDRIHREHHLMDEHGAVNRVFAVVARVMVTAGDVEAAFVDKWEPLGGFTGQTGRNLRRVIRIDGGSIAGDGGPSERKR